MRTPLGPATKFNEVCTRVAVRLVQLDHKRNPSAYHVHRASAILALSNRLRDEQITAVWPYLVSCSKAVHAGMSLDQWRSWAMQSSPDTMRSIHKRPFRPRSTR